MASPPGEAPAEGSTQPPREESSPTANATMEIQPKKSRKRKKKTAGAKGGTGFEEFYCDPPMTPEEALEEKSDIYSSDRSFVDRIEDCIQRYRARRRLDNDRTNIFNKYLALGGIDTSPRQFQGGSKIDLDGATSSEIREAMASDVIHRAGNDSRFYNPNHPEHWDVDFAGIAAGFFSERILTLVGSDLHLIKTTVDLVQNFLNYVLHHDVCPEYSADIRQAKGICDQALDQIPRIFGIWRDVPGDFSTAAQTLFCHGEEMEFTVYYSGGAKESMDRKRAVVVVMATLATMDDVSFDLVRKTWAANAIQVVEEVEQAFEIVELRQPSDEVVRLYLGVKDPASGVPGSIEPCGHVVLKPTTIQDGWDTGLFTSLAPGIGDQETLVLERSIMRYLIAGMKLKLVVCTLNIGVKFIKEFKEIHPSYYTFLPQELMLNYKEPIPSLRPAPSVEDPDVEDAQMDQAEKE